MKIKQNKLCVVLQQKGLGQLFYFDISGFIVFDTQMIMKRVSPEEYIVATIELYLDIINLFIEILKIMEKVNRK